MNARSRLAAIPVGAMLLTAMAGAPALADSLLLVAPRATLVARGAAVDVRVTYTCPRSGGSGTLAVELTQPRAQRLTTAETTLNAVCDGTSQTTTARLFVWGAPFKPGTARVDAYVYTIDEEGSYSRAEVSQDVRLARNPVPPAGADPMLSLAPRATLVDRGAAVDVPITYTCPTPGTEDPYTYLEAWVVQAIRDHRTTRAWGGLNPVCDGAPHSAALRLHVAEEDPLLRSGTAVVQGRLDYDVAGIPGWVEVSREVRFGNG